MSADQSGRSASTSTSGQEATMTDLTIVRTDSPCPVCHVGPGGRHDGQAHDNHTLNAALREEAIKDGPRGG